MDPSKHYLLSDGRLFEYSVQPLYFGSTVSGTLLGYMISGYAIDGAFLREVGRGAGAEAAFLAGDAVTLSTLPEDKQLALRQLAQLQQPGSRSAIAMIGKERFLTVGKDLSSGADTSLRLVVMKSFDAADRAENEINWLIFWVSCWPWPPAQFGCSFWRGWSPGPWNCSRQAFEPLAKAIGNTRFPPAVPRKCAT
jgi:hypothetical protein